jgi:acetyl-CoA carboxylase biotin carboxyl carrier protein
MRVEEIRRLIDLVEQSQIDELEVRRWWSTVRIARVGRGANGRSGPASAQAGAPAQAVAAHTLPAPATSGAAAPGHAAPVPAAAPAGVPETLEHVHQAGLLAIVSPMVGTFYAAPSPTAPPYLEVGDRVKHGQVVCIVEAMKLMNEIEAEISGTIAEILVQNEQPVEYNQPLFLVRPGA